MKTIAFFNNKGGVGKTSLVYHLAWMFAEMDIRVVAADFDPQASLTSMFLSEDRLEKLWPDKGHPLTIWGAIDPILSGIGDIGDDPHVESIDDNLGLICGDLGLSTFEERLSVAWQRCHDGDLTAVKEISSFSSILQKAAMKQNAELLLIDMEPNLGAINHAVLIAADYVIIPITPDLFYIQGLKNLGITLRKWKKEWKECLSKNPENLILLNAEMKSIGYVVLKKSIRINQLTKSYNQRVNKVPQTYKEYILSQDSTYNPTMETEEHCLSIIKYYHSLMPMAAEAGKPIFKLTPADGCTGSHMQAAQECYWDFNELARKIAEKAEIEIPSLQEH